MRCRLSTKIWLSRVIVTPGTTVLILPFLFMKNVPGGHPLSLKNHGLSVTQNSIFTNFYFSRPKQTVATLAYEP